MRASVVVIATVLVASIALGLTQAISVEPRTAAWSGWTRTVEPNDRVSQIITCNFDSLAYVELFAGEYGQGGAYNLEVLTYPGGAPVANQDGGTYLRPYHWVRFDNLTVSHPDLIVKGKQLEFRFTRAGADSIECAAMTNV